MHVDDMVVMMQLLDADGDGQVTKLEFGTFYKRLNSCSDASFEAMWTRMDKNGDGVLTLNELCEYYGIDMADCANASKAQRAMDDAMVLEALQVQSIVNEARQKQQQHQKQHRDRLHALAELAEAEEEEEEGDKVSSPTAVTARATATPTFTMQELVRDSKRRGDLAAHHYK